jgi:hypothetical protein
LLGAVELPEPKVFLNQLTTSDQLQPHPTLWLLQLQLFSKSGLALASAVGATTDSPMTNDNTSTRRFNMMGPQRCELQRVTFV